MLKKNIYTSYHQYPRNDNIFLNVRDVRELIPALASNIVGVIAKKITGSRNYPS